MTVKLTFENFDLLYWDVGFFVFQSNQILEGQLAPEITIQNDNGADF